MRDAGHRLLPTRRGLLADTYSWRVNCLPRHSYPALSSEKRPGSGLRVAQQQVADDVDPVAAGEPVEPVAVLLARRVGGLGHAVGVQDQEGSRSFG